MAFYFFFDIINKVEKTKQDIHIIECPNGTIQQYNKFNPPFLCDNILIQNPILINNKYLYYNNIIIKNGTEK